MGWLARSLSGPSARARPGVCRRTESGAPSSARAPCGVSPASGPAERNQTRKSTDLCHLQLRRVRHGGQLRAAA
eukprot:14126945-Alexandrium_andersonii.AAC.1